MSQQNEKVATIHRPGTGQQGAPATPPGRRCVNCYFNPSGQVCQRWPMEITVMPVMQEVPDPARIGFVRQQQAIQKSAEPRMTPPHYCCGEHAYENEVVGADGSGWKWLDEPLAPEPPKDAAL